MYEVPISQSDIDFDNNISVRREYYVDGVETTNFDEGDLIEVRIYPEFSSKALQGSYQVTDLLPSGLQLLTSSYRRGIKDYCGIRYPYESWNQRIKFLITGDENWEYCHQNYFRYYARVVNPGTYVAEPVILQSFESDESINMSEATEIVITQ